MSKSSHSNGPQLLGHIYQLDMALYEFLKVFEENATIRIEWYGDFNINDDGIIISAEVKEHLTSKKLTDKSEDLWKTIDCWIEAFRDNEDSYFCLYTTDELSQGSIAYYLSEGSVNVDEAIRVMDKCSSEGGKKYECYLSLSEEEKTRLFHNARVYPSQPNATAMDQELKKAVSIAPLEYQDNLISLIRGAWVKQVVESLENGSSTITRDIFNTIIRRYIEERNAKTLPIYTDQVLTEEVKELIFWKQLELINSTENRKNECAIMYLTAENHKNRWLSELLTDEKELEQYENALISSWRIMRMHTTGKLKSDADEKEKRVAGMDLLEKMEEKPIPIRSRVIDDKIYCGYLQILSNEKKMGWHPDYLKLLEDNQ